MNIDWSKAPEGTTHFHPMVDGYVPHWVKVKGDKSWFCVTDFEREGWREDVGKPGTKNMIPMPPKTMEERQARAIDLIKADLNCTTAMAEDIYKAGYRKFEIVEDDV